MTDSLVQCDTRFVARHQSALGVVPWTRHAQQYALPAIECTAEDIMRLVEAAGEAESGALMPHWPSAEPEIGSRTQPPSTAAASAAALPAASQDVTIPLRSAALSSHSKSQVSGVRESCS